MLLQSHRPEEQRKCNMALEARNYIHPPRTTSLIQKQTKEIGFTMSSDDLTGALLSTLAASKPAGHFLEIGTGTGAGTAWLLDGMDQEASLVSIENDADLTAFARSTLGHDKRLTLIHGDAYSFIGEQVPESFDLIFADSYPGKHALLKETLNLVRKGGFYIIDDMLPQPGWPEQHLLNLAKLLEDLTNVTG